MFDLCTSYRASGCPMDLAIRQGDCGFWAMMGPREDLRDRGKRKINQSINQSGTATRNTQDYMNWLVPGFLQSFLFSTLLKGPVEQQRHLSLGRMWIYSIKLNLFNKKCSIGADAKQRWTFDESVFLTVSGVKKHATLFAMISLLQNYCNSSDLSLHFRSLILTDIREIYV